MENFQKFLEEKLGPVMSKVGANRFLLAIRDGVISALPLIIVGSFFLILACPPLPEGSAAHTYLTSHAGEILLPFRMTMYIMSLYAVFGMGNSLARSYDLDGLTGGILSVLALLLTLTPSMIPAEAELDIVGFAMPMGNLGGGGLFVGIITSIIAVEIFRWTQTSNFKITMPDQVPEPVARSFEALTPTLLVVLVMSFITYYLGFDWHSAIKTAVAPLISATDSLGGVLVLVFLTDFFWFFGIHGASIVGSVARPLWLALLEENAEAAAAGVAATQLPAISPEPFYQWFIYLGGAGATLGLAILLLTVCKSKYAKELGKVGIIPSLFNINEPIIFGTPIVLNPTLMIPFTLAPIVNALIAWFATSMGLVARCTIVAPWTLPGPIGAYLATGGDWRASVLNIILIVVSMLIYYPFVRIYDRQFLDQEALENEAAKDAE